jgi:hypothetical protein
MKLHLVLTTINNPLLLEEYARQAANVKGTEIAFTIAGDNKTPPEARQLCEKLQSNFGVPITYQGVTEQNDFLKRWPKFASYLPWNCIQRRNVAILHAYLAGADVIVTIDDDNFIATDNYFGPYLTLGHKTPLPTVIAPSRWFNICHFLKDRQDRIFFPRGYPLRQRNHTDEIIDIKPTPVRSVVNGGLWLGDPDIDAVTRLAAPIDAVKYTYPNNFALGPDVWCPFNSQNTGIHRDCIPAYFLCPNIGRYDDIWASFIILRLANHMGDAIAFGEPLVKQNRNAHNLYRDFEDERLGLQLSDDFCDWLRAVPLTASSYHEGGRELIEALKQKMHSTNVTLNAEQKQFLQNFITGYTMWLDLDLWP